MTTIDEATRLEQLWHGEFGDAYVDRNADAGGARGPFWRAVAEQFPFRSVLEVGSNVGANLRHLIEITDPTLVWGIDVNEESIAQCHQRLPQVNSGWATARNLPFRDRFFDMTFTVAVLIHQPDETLSAVIDELVRCSDRWVLSVEYTADVQTEVTYRGETGAFFKRPYGDVIAAARPDLALRHRVALTKADGFDDGLECVVFERL